MRKALKVFAIAVAGLLVLMILLPLLFKGKIREQVQKEIDRNLNARVTFGKVGLSFFSHFPALTLRLNDLSVVGIDEFQNDTLAGISSFSMTLNLMSVIKGEDYEVSRIILDSPRILLKVTADGKVNWDIMKPSASTDSVEEPSAFKVSLEKIIVKKATFCYIDDETPMVLAVRDLDGTMGGDMTADVTTLDIDAKAKYFMVEYDGIRYIGGVTTQLVTHLQADLTNWKFTFNGADVRLNDLNILADGFFAMPEDGYDMDIRFKAVENNFRSFLSLVPAIYARDFQSVKTEGSMELSGLVKGMYNDLQFPAFSIGLKINSGSFAYPSLPGNISEINIVAAIENPDGVIDHTLVDIPSMHMRIINNPIDASFTLRTPESDPDLKGWIKGMLNFSDIAKVYPLGEKTTLTGSMNADLRLEGRLSSVESSRYEEFKAEGFALLKDIAYSSPELSVPVSIKAAKMDFSPAYIALSDFSMAIGNSDLSAEGRLENYLPYFLRDHGVLKGTLSTSSNLMDINKLMAQATDESNSSDSSGLTVIEVPGNIDFTLRSGFGRLVYDTYDLQNVSGTVLIKDKSLIIQGLKAEMMGGSVMIDGTYNTFDPGNPMVDMSLNIEKVNVKQTFEAFNTVKSFAPVAERLQGDISSRIRFNGNLKQDMMPDLTTIDGAGLVLSDILSVESLNTFNVVADVLKIEKLRKPSLEKVNLSFDLVDGKATVKPMDFRLAGYASNFSGTIGLDQTINFILNLEIPRSDFGGKANGVLNGLVNEAAGKGVKVNLGNVVPVTLLIGGTTTQPKVTAGIKQSMAGVVEDLKQQAIEQVKQKKEEIVAKAKEEANRFIDEADAKAAAIMATARQQSEQVLKTAAIAAEKVRSQADSAASKVIAEGKKNGMIAEIAAKKTAEKIKKEADSKSDKILGEARTRSEGILNKAQSEADKIKQEARNRVK